MTKEHQDFVRLITQAINRFKARTHSDRQIWRYLLTRNVFWLWTDTQDKVRNIVEDIVGPVIQSQVCPLVSALAQKFQAQASDGATPHSRFPILFWLGLTLVAVDDEVEIDVVSEEEREWTDMIKGYLLLIQSVLGHSLSSTLIAQVRLRTASAVHTFF